MNKVTLLFIADCVPKMDEEIKRIFPRADFHLYTIHVSRKLESDKKEIDLHLTEIFLSVEKHSTIERFNHFGTNGLHSIENWYTKWKRYFDISQHVFSVLRVSKDHCGL